MQFVIGLLLFGLTAAVAASDGQTPMPVRVLYGPAHFGNSYEVMGERELAQYLSEARAFGFNHYADWFNTIDCSDPFTNDFYNLGRTLWERKKTHFRAAMATGLPFWLVVTPNHVFLDQCRPELAATTSDRIFGQLVCPSNPDARALILDNYDNLFSDLANAGVHLAGIASAPYDYGGCACDHCAPWIVTFAKLSHDIFEVAAKYHTNVAMHFIGWWWTPVEHEQFAAWADANAPGWAKSMFLHISYGNVDVANVPLPAGCERRAFVHIGYAEEASPRDTYGHLGPVIAADRIEKTVRALAARGCTGVMAYSEGVFDDVNKALLAGLAADQYDSADDVLAAYAREFLGADETNAADWVAWLRAWGTPYTVDATEAVGALHRLATDTAANSWRVEPWKAKTRLMQRYAAVAAGDTWTPDRLAAADAFWAEQERMQREVYGLGSLRHVLNRRYSPFPWYAGWAKATATTGGRTPGEQ